MIINWFFEKTYRHRCPDGSVKLVFKNIDEAFPLSIKEEQKKFDTELKVQQQAAFNLHADYASKIQGLLYSISELNQSLMVMFRTSYIGYKSDPCSSHSFLLRQIESVIEQQHRLIELKTQISGLITMAKNYPNNPEAILPMYQEIVNKIGNKHYVAAAEQAIAENRNAAQQWIGGENA